MPLTKIELNNTGGWALWHVTETEAELEAMFTSEGCDEKIVYPSKKLEWLASRMLTEKLANELKLPFKKISKDEFGKPFFENSSIHVSLSHSYPHVAVQISFVNAVGIDIEKPSSKITKVAHRIFSAKERADAADNLEKNCIYWCAKEALYKIYGKRGLSYADNLMIEPFTLGESGEIEAAVVTKELRIPITLNYLVTNDIVIVYTKSVR